MGLQFYFQSLEEPGIITLTVQKSSLLLIGLCDAFYATMGL